MTARSALYFCAMMAIATVSRAQLINIKVDGFVHFSTSDTLPLGAGVHLSFTLPDPPIGRPNPVFPGHIFSYDSLASSVVVGATNFPLVANLAYVGTRDLPTRPNGFATAWHAFFYDAFDGMGLDFASWTHDVTTPDGILKPGLPLDDFDERSGYFYKFIGNDPLAEFIGRFTVTGYSVTHLSAVPEPSTFGVLAVIGLFAFAARRRLSRRSAI